MSKEALASTRVTDISATTRVADPTAEVLNPRTDSQINFEEDAGLGMENIRGRDMAIPYLAILQKGSPQVDDLSQKHVEGARPGHILNTVANKVFEPPVYVIECGFTKELVEWKPRDSGGGFVARHTENDPILKQCTADDRGRLVTPNGNLIIDTAYHYVLFLEPGGQFKIHVSDEKTKSSVDVEFDSVNWAIVSMQSTQLKKSRTWNTTKKTSLIPGRGKPYPSFAHVYKLGSIGESKDKYTWFGWTVDQVGLIADPNVYTLAKDFAKQVAAGTVQISAPPAPMDEAAHPDSVPF